MFIILLTYLRSPAEVDRFLAAHRAWVRQGFDDGVFLLSGGQKPRVGGALLAHGTERGELEARVALDPFVLEGMATATIIEVVLSTLDPRLGFLQAH